MFGPFPGLTPLLTRDTMRASRERVTPSSIDSIERFATAGLAVVHHAARCLLAQLIRARQAKTALDLNMGVER